MYRPRVFVVSTLSAALDRAAVVLSGAEARGGRDRAQRRDKQQPSAYDVRTFGSVAAACDEIRLGQPDAAVLMLRDTTPESCLQACLELQELLSPHGTPLAVIFPSTDPTVWRRIYASGANIFLPWHGEVIAGLATYVASLLSQHGGRESAGPSSGSLRRSSPRIVLDERRRCAHIKNWQAEFTPIQFRILRHLVRNNGRLVSKGELARVLTEARPMEHAQPSASLYQHISQIRKRLGPHAGIVRCVRSRGYLLDTSFLAA